MVGKPPMVVWIVIFMSVMLGLTVWQIVGTPFLALRFQQPQQSYKHVPKIREETDILYSADSLPKWDFTRLIDLNAFTFLLTNTVCENLPLDLLVVIHSAPKNLDRRNAIRQTWGQRRDDMKVLFMLGGVDDQKTQDDFDAEDRKYHDLVQGNFKDAYKNLTYKHIMAFKYTVYYCPSAKYVLKTDDDFFVNTPAFMEYVHSLPEKRNFILCSIMDGSPAIREPSKWKVPFSEFPHSFYPVYCSGFAVLYSYDVVFRLYREAQRGDYFWVDDAHVTGTLAKRINLKHTQLPPVMINHKEMEKFIKSNGTSGNKFFYGPVNISPETVRKLWKALELGMGKIPGASTNISRKA